MTALASGLTPADVLNSTTALIVAVLTIGGSIVLSIVDRRARRREVGTEWERRADALTRQLANSYSARLRDKDEQIRAVTADRNYWRNRWMGVPDDRSGIHRQRPRGAGAEEAAGAPDGPPPRLGQGPQDR